MSKEVHLSFFFIFRAFDLLSTYSAMKKYNGWESIEANPFNAALIGTFGFPIFILINLIFSCFAGFLLYKVDKRLLVAFNLIQGIVVCINLYANTL